MPARSKPRAKAKAKAKATAKATAKPKTKRGPNPQGKPRQPRSPSRGGNGATPEEPIRQRSRRRESALPPGEQGSAPGARPIWSGTITFGLVNVPVDLYPALRPHGVRLRMLDEDGAPLGRRYVCPAEGKRLEPDDIVRGYEIEKGTFVVVTDEELEALEPEKSRDIDLRRFVDAERIPPLYFERPYVLAPTGRSNKAYRLLAKVMEEEGKAGVATFVMRDKEYLVAILASRGILRLQTLRFANELRTPAAVGLPEPRPARAKERGALEKAIAGRTERRLAAADMRDDVAEGLEKLVEKKRRAKKDVIETEPSPEAGEDFVDLMALLKEKVAAA